jgi:hypothetical protein
VQAFTDVTLQNTSTLKCTACSRNKASICSPSTKAAHNPMHDILFQDELNGSHQRSSSTDNQCGDCISVISMFQQSKADYVTHLDKNTTVTHVGPYPLIMPAGGKITSANYQIMLLKPLRVNPVWKP